MYKSVPLSKQDLSLGAKLTSDCAIINSTWHTVLLYEVLIVEKSAPERNAVHT